MSNESKKSFFISYNRADRDWAEWIAWQLEESGYTTTIQAWDFGSGSDFVVQMQKAAVECERTIGVLSPDSLNAPFVQREWAAAIAADPLGEQRKLVLARVRECNPEGLYHSSIYINLVNLQPDQARDRLLTELKVGRKKPNVAPTFPGTKPPSSAQPSPGHLAPKSSHFPGDTVSVYLCAAAEDEAHAVTLRKHLAVAERGGVLRTWRRGDIKGGMVEHDEIEAHFTESRLLVLLITKDFLASDECADLMERAKAQRVRTIPVLVGPSQFSDTVLGGMVALPRDNVPITSRRDHDGAWSAIAKEITTLARDIAKSHIAGDTVRG